MSATANLTYRALQRLPLLYALLQQGGYSLNPARWLAVEDLLFQLHQRGQLAQGVYAVEAYIAAVVCQTPEQQQGFSLVFLEWLQQANAMDAGSAKALRQQQQHYQNLSGKKQRPPRSGVDPIQPQPALRRALKYFAKQRRRMWASFALLVLVLVGAALFVSDRATNKAPEASPRPTTPPSEGPSAPATGKKGSAQRTLAAIPPNQQPLPAKLQGPWRQQWRLLQWLAPALPQVVFLLWLAWCLWQRRVVLDLLKHEKNQPFTRISLNLPHNLIFTVNALAGPFRQLLSTPLRRLHLGRTTKASAKALRYSPVFRQRQERPEYLFLIDRAHKNDHRAYLALNLVKQLQAQQVLLHTYEYQQNPLWCYSNQGARRPLPLSKLARLYPRARLVVVGNAKGLFHPLSGKLHHWAQQLGAWQRRAWLSSSSQAWAYRESQLALLGFAVAPLSQAGVAAIAQWWQHGRPGVWFNCEPAQPSQPRLAGEALPYSEQRWLQARPPKQFNAASFRRSLRQYLSAEAYRLLCACAAYPELHTQLTLALDLRLFGDSAVQSEQREQRLQALFTLPWFQFGRLPNYLRKALIAGVSRREQATIGEAYLAVFKSTQRDPGQDWLPLPFTHKAETQGWALLRNMLRFAPKNHSALADRLFAQVVFAGKRGPHYFVLPEFLARILPGKRWHWHSAATVGGVVLLASLLSAYLLYGPYRPALKQWHYARQVNYYREFEVIIRADAAARPLAQHLSGALIAAGFVATAIKILPTQAEENSAAAAAKSLTYYSAAGQYAASELARHLRQISYGEWALLPQLGQVESESAKQIKLVLNGGLQGGTDFRDELPQEALAKLDVFRDSLSDGSLGPAMVVIPAGEYLMGSPETELGHGSDEGPQHQVTIARFALAQHEVTWDDYRKYIASTGGSLPGDEGWGQGKRPIINVSWEDAQAYASWLSEQSGQVYRLPSEAEWEYAARAGTTTPFYTGDCITASQANFDDTSGYAYGNCPSSGEFLQQTVPVGSYAPNAFGLYDMHGNVWEWVEDCWHENYEAAPTNGSAWLEAASGDCTSRVLRGGSWYNYPRRLRSAERFWLTPDVRIIYLGFRLARTL